MKPHRLSITGLALALLSCSGGGQATQGTGKLSIKLTDAPGDLTAAMVTISEIDLVGANGPIVLSTTKVTTDLLKLANDTVDLVTDAVVPAGTYTELRFVITGGYVEVQQAGGGSIIYASSPSYEGLPEGAQVGGTLRMPSYAHSGLKVDLPAGGVTVGTESKVVLVDFDVAQSFGHVAGSSGAWVMHPVVKATELELSGNVVATLKLAEGVTLPGTTTLADFSAVLTSSSGSAKTLPLQDAGGGTFSAAFRFLLPGAYTLDFTGPAGLTFTVTPATPAAVTVGSGQQTELDFTLTSATAKAP